MNRWNRWLLILLTGAAFVIPAGARAALTAEQVFAALKPDLRKQLLAGEIVTLARPEQETNDSGLAVSLAVIVPADLNKTVSTFRSLNVKDDAKQRRTTREINGSVRGDGSSPAFATIGFAADEKEEVKKMLRAEPGDDFNFSMEELAWIGQAAASGADPEIGRAHV